MWIFTKYSADEPQRDFRLTHCCGLRVAGWKPEIGYYSFRFSRISNFQFPLINGFCEFSKLLYL